MVVEWQGQPDPPVPIPLYVPMLCPGAPPPVFSCHQCCLWTSLHFTHTHTSRARPMDPFWGPLHGSILVPLLSCLKLIGPRLQPTSPTVSVPKIPYQHKNFCIFWQFVIITHVLWFWADKLGQLTQLVWQCMAFWLHA